LRPCRRRATASNPVRPRRDWHRSLASKPPAYRGANPPAHPFAPDRALWRDPARRHVGLRARHGRWRSGHFDARRGACAPQQARRCGVWRGAAPPRCMRAVARGSAQCPRWKARGPGCRPTVRQAVAWPHPTTRLRSLRSLRTPKGVCACRLGASRRDHPHFPGAARHFLAFARKRRAAPGCGRPRFFSLPLEKSVTDLVLSRFARSDATGVVAARFACRRQGGARRPPHTNRPAWAGLFWGVGALHRTRKKRAFSVGALAPKFRDAAPPSGAGLAFGSTYPRREPTRIDEADASRFPAWRRLPSAFP